MTKPIVKTQSEPTLKHYTLVASEGTTLFFQNKDNPGDLRALDEKTFVATRKNADGPKQTSSLMNLL